MPKTPSTPDLPPRQSVPPRVSSVALEAVKERERTSAAKRSGYKSTMATRPGDLGQLNTEKKKVLGV